MLINKNKTINQIKSEFANMFPNLKLEFFVKEHQVKEGSPLDQRIFDNLHLGSLSKIEEQKDFDITPDLKVSSLEQAFEKQFGLHVQVYRKSENLWLQTTSTDEWTLKHQNDAGLARSK